MDTADDGVVLPVGAFAGRVDVVGDNARLGFGAVGSQYPRNGLLNAVGLRAAFLKTSGQLDCKIEELIVIHFVFFKIHNSYGYFLFSFSKSAKKYSSIHPGMQ